MQLYHAGYWRFTLLLQMALSIFLSSLTIWLVTAQTCFDNQYPLIFGGTNDDTSFMAMDMDEMGNILVGGYTRDSSLAQAYGTYQNYEPIVTYIQKGGFFRWSNNLYSTSTDYDMVTAVKFSPDYKYVIAFMNDVSYRKPLFMSVLNAVNGTLIRTIKDSSGKEAEVHTESLWFEPTTQDLILGARIGSGSTKWMVMRFSPLALALNPAVTSVSPAFAYVNSNSDASSTAGALSIIPNQAQDGLFIGGLIRSDTGTMYQTLSKIDLNSGTLTYHYGYSDTKQHILQMELVSGEMSTLWHCSENSQNLMLVGKVDLDISTETPIGGSSSQLQAIIILIFNSLFQTRQQCHAIYPESDTLIYVASSYNNMMRLTNIDFAASPMVSRYYSFDGKFSGSSVNIMTGARFHLGKLYTMGMIRTFSLTPAFTKTFSRGVAYVLGIDPFGASNSFTCDSYVNTLTVVYTEDLSLTEYALDFANIMSQITMSTFNAQMMADTSITLRRILSTALVAPVCSISTVYAFDTSYSTLPTQAYTVGAIAEPTSYAISTGSSGADFSLSSTTSCSDTEFYLTATLSSTTATVPMAWTFDQETNTIDWSKAVNDNWGTYTIDVTAYIGTGAFLRKQIQVVVTADCMLATLQCTTPSAFYYYVSTTSASPMTISWDPFTSDKTVSTCGQFIYTLFDQSQTPSTPLQIGTMFFQPDATQPYMTLSTSTTPPGNTYQIEVRGSQSMAPTLYISMTFSIFFVNTCTGTTITAPADYSLDYTMGSISAGTILPHTIAAFATSIGACEQELSYSTPALSVPYFFTIVNNGAVGSLPKIDVVSLTNSDSGTYVLEFTSSSPSTPGLTHPTLTITINMLPDCGQVRITSSTIQSLVYDISENLQSIQIAQIAWDAEYSLCTSQLIYKLKDLDTLQNPDTSVFTLTSDNRIVLSTRDPSKARTYKLMLIGSINGFGVIAQENFTVQVTNKCPTATLVTTPVPDQTYTIGSAPLKVSISPWSDSLGASQCGAITYSAVGSDDTVLNPEVFKFDAASRTLSVFTANSNNAQGIYVKIQGRLTSSGRTNSVIFRVDLVDPCSKTVIMPSPLRNINYEVGQGKSVIYLGKWTESLGICGDFDFSFTLTPAIDVQLFTYDNSAKNLEIDIASGFDQDAEFIIKVKGTLKSGAFSEQTFTLSVKAPLVTSSKNLTEVALLKKKIAKMEPTLTAKITKIDTYGLVSMQFTKSLIALEDLGIYSQKKAMSLIVEPNTDDAKKYAITDWSVVAQSGSSMQIQISFPDPYGVSLSTNFDSLRVKFNLPTLFYSLDEKSIIKKDLQIVGKIPPQNVQTTSSKSLQASTESVSSVLVGSLGANFVLCAVCGVSMSNVFQLMNNIQLIAMVPLMKVSTPPQFIAFCQTMQDFANLNILPEEASLPKIKERIIGETEGSESLRRRLLNEEENSKSQMSATFEMMGIESPAILDNLGNIVQMLAAIILAAIGLSLVKLSCKSRPRVMKLHNKVSKMIFFSSYISSTTQGYLNMSISIFISLTYFSENTYFEKIVTSILAVYLITFPIVSCVFLYRNHHILETDSVKEKYGSLYDTVEPQRNRLAPMAQILFMVRRIILALTMIFLGEYSWLQIIIWVWMSMLMLVYHVHARPYSERVFGLFEFINDLSVLLISYLMIAVAQFESSEMRDILGTMLITIVVVTVVLNLLNFLYSFARDIAHLLRKIYKASIALLKKLRNKDKTVKMNPGLSETGQKLQESQMINSLPQIITINEETPEERQNRIVALTRIKRLMLERSMQIRNLDNNIVSDMGFRKFLPKAIEEVKVEDFFPQAESVRVNIIADKASEQAESDQVTNITQTPQMTDSIESPKMALRHLLKPKPMSFWLKGSGIKEY